MVSQVNAVSEKSDSSLSFCLSALQTSAEQTEQRRKTNIEKEKKGGENKRERDRDETE